MAKASVIEDFEKMEQLGKGSFGTVYKAKHKERSKIVALKEIKLNSEEEGITLLLQNLLYCYYAYGAYKFRNDITSCVTMYVNI